ncbi:MAG: hypothetical protein WBM65_07340 [Sedimenticolaceae bacterium]
MKHKLTLMLIACALCVSPGLQAESTAKIAEGDSLMLEEALSEDDLAINRGEGVALDDMTLNEIDMDGTNHSNSVMNSVTGQNFIGNGAFNGASGMFDTIQNSGNNVLIQNATIVNINMSD